MTRTTRTRRCNAPHAQLIADGTLFATLPLVGQMHEPAIGVHLEMRNCSCGSTVSRPLPGHVVRCEDCDEVLEGAHECARPLRLAFLAHER